jgi:hypothetical protein
MNWEAVGAIGQVLGSIAVFVTLGYLAVQVQYARQEVRRSVSQSRSQGARELALNHANNERLTSTYRKANAGLGAGPMSPFVATLMERSGLTAEEADGLWWEQLAIWQNRVQSISYSEEMTTGARIELDGILRLFYGGTGVTRLWYETVKERMNPDAVRYIDNLLAQPN